jgi:hypothetical protein
MSRLPAPRHCLFLGLAITLTGAAPAHGGGAGAGVMLPADVVPLPPREARSLGDIIADRQAFHGRPVTVRGILGETGAGGRWLYAEEQTDRIFVRFPAGARAVEGWHEVTVTGVIEVRTGAPVIVAMQIRPR